MSSILEISIFEDILNGNRAAAEMRVDSMTDSEKIALISYCYEIIDICRDSRDIEGDD